MTTIRLRQKKARSDQQHAKELEVATGSKTHKQMNMVPALSRPEVESAPARSDRSTARARAPEDAKDGRVTEVANERTSPHDDEQHYAPDCRASCVAQSVDCGSTSDLKWRGLIGQNQVEGLPRCRGDARSGDPSATQDEAKSVAVSSLLKASAEGASGQSGLRCLRWQESGLRRLTGTHDEQVVGRKADKGSVPVHALLAKNPI